MGNGFSGVEILGHMLEVYGFGGGAGSCYRLGSVASRRLMSAARPFGQPHLKRLNFAVGCCVPRR